MKVLFLDIDGVLNTDHCKVRTPSGYDFVEDDKILLLKEIINVTNAKVVLSSTWRIGWEDVDNGDINTSNAVDFLALKEKLKEFGIELYDYTPCPITSQRGLRIKEWIDNQTEEITSIVILDDRNNMSPLGKFLVQTSPINGISKKNVAKAIKVLNEEDFIAWYKKKF